MPIINRHFPAWQNFVPPSRQPSSKSHSSPSKCLHPRLPCHPPTTNATTTIAEDATTIVAEVEDATTTSPLQLHQHLAVFHLHPPMYPTTATAARNLPTPTNTTIIRTTVSPADTTSPCGIPAPPAITSGPITKSDAPARMWPSVKPPGMLAPNAPFTRPSCQPTPLLNKLDGEGHWHWM